MSMYFPFTIVQFRTNDFRKRIKKYQEKPGTEKYYPKIRIIHGEHLILPKKGMSVSWQHNFG